MIRKIFKTITILSLCIGISLPTNAAVSVSDGSAFVTKAEFSADLNNLSNRMAQLENSLDAKIDSLVSSYLTRNGIWNGAKQKFEMDYYMISPYKNADLTTSFTWTNGSNGYTGKTMSGLKINKKVSAKTPTSYSSGIYYKQTWDSNKVLVSNLDKSGMLTIVIQVGFNNTWIGTTGGNARCWYIPFTENHRLVGMTGVHFDFSVGTGSTKESKLDIATLSALWDKDYPTALPYGILNSDATYFFFVEKGQTLSFDVYWDYMSYVNNGGFQTNKDWEPYCDAKQAIAMVFKDCAIY